MDERRMLAGSVLRRLRERQRMTIEGLAELVEVDQSMVWRWEAGVHSRLRDKNRAGLAAHLHVSDDDLRSLLTDPTPEKARALLGQTGYTEGQCARNKAAKKAMAEYVVREIIPTRSTVYLDAGSTIAEIGSLLFANAGDVPLSGLSVMTNNMLVHREFALWSDLSGRGNQLALTGGVYDQNHEALFGDVATGAIEAYEFKVVIIGVSGLIVSPNIGRRRGAYNHGFHAETPTKKALTKKATDHRVYVVDYSKIDEPDAACFVEWDDVASGATECSIVTSTVPEDVPIEERHRYESRYAALNEAVERLREKPGQTVSLRRVNSDGELA